MSFLSVIFVTFNSADVIVRALTAVETHLPDADVIVVDNGSADDTCDLAASFPRVRLIVGHGNPGFGAGVNLGAQAARGRLLLVLNPDAFLASVDQPALSILASQRPLGILACQLQSNGRLQRAVQVRWGWRRELCWALMQWYLIPRQVDILRPRPRRNSKTWITGAAFVVNREEFLRVGGFDRRLFLYYEDFDLSRKYASRGLSISSTESVTLDHVGHASSPRDNDLTMTWAIMSLIEQTGKWDGVAVSCTAASWTWHLLSVIEVIGRRVSRLPWIGPRGRRKADSAARVKAHLRTASRNEEGNPWYPLARAALRGEVCSPDTSTVAKA